MSAKKGFFSQRKVAPPTSKNSEVLADRFDLADFEQQVVEEARANNQIKVLDKNLIDPDPQQPRSHFDAESLAELRQSIEQNGLIQPIVVRQVGERFQIIAGERRWRACQDISTLTHIEAVIRNDVDPLTILLLQIAENNHRQSMTPMDIARAYQRVKELMEGSQKLAAQKLGVSESQMSITLGLLKSPTLIQELAENGKIRDITTLNIVNRLHEQDPSEARRVVDAIIDGKLEIGSVRKHINSTLQRSKGKIEHAQVATAVKKIKAKSMAVHSKNNKLVLTVTSAQGDLEIALPYSKTDILAMLSEQP